jgi:hypothetical protein
MANGKITGRPIETPSSLPSIATSAKTKAYTIIAAKGMTSFGMTSIVHHLRFHRFDQRHVGPVSHWVERFGSYVSMPAGGSWTWVCADPDWCFVEWGRRGLLVEFVEEIKDGLDGGKCLSR